MDLGLDGRVFLVTGGSKGLGFATAAALVADGARVVLSSRGKENVDAAVARLGGNAVGIAADNAEPDLADRLVTVARERFGRLDGLLVSVGGPPLGTVVDTDPETWVAAFDSIFVGTLRLVRRVGAELADGDGGAIGLVLSTSVREPLPNLAVSNGLRPGLAMVGKTLADELGPRGVRVVGLLPGAFNTERSKDLAGATARFATVPLRRIGEPEEFGRVAAFALSPAASYLTGTMVTIDGGAVRAH